jgi:hypothetical protein
MTTAVKLLEKAIKSPQNLKYKEFETLLGHNGYVKERQTGSHAMWRAIGKPRMCIQNDRGKAKIYQVKEFLEAIDAKI